MHAFAPDKSPSLHRGFTLSDGWRFGRGELVHVRARRTRYRTNMTSKFWLVLGFDPFPLRDLGGLDTPQLVDSGHRTWKRAAPYHLCGRRESARKKHQSRERKNPLHHKSE